MTARLVLFLMGMWFGVTMLFVNLKVVSPGARIVSYTAMWFGFAFSVAVMFRYAGEVW